MLSAVFNVALFEVAEAVRSRRFVVLTLLFTGGAVVGSLVFTRMLEAAMESLRSNVPPEVQAAAAETPGGLAQLIRESPEFASSVEQVVGDPGLAKLLIETPPLVLFFGWMAMAMAPMLVMLTSSDCVASDLASGSARYVFVRVDRSVYAAGKLLGQAALITVSLFAAALGSWFAGPNAIQGFDVATPWELIWMVVRVACFTFAYVGLAVGISHLTRGVAISRAVGLGALVAFGLAGFALETDSVTSDWPQLSHALLQLLPATHKAGLWKADLASRLPSTMWLLALGTGYTALGYLFRRRRDA